MIHNPVIGSAVIAHIPDFERYVGYISRIVVPKPGEVRIFVSYPRDKWNGTHSEYMFKPDELTAVDKD